MQQFRMINILVLPVVIFGQEFDNREVMNTGQTDNLLYIESINPHAQLEHPYAASNLVRYRYVAH